MKRKVTAGKRPLLLDPYKQFAAKLVRVKGHGALTTDDI